MKKMKNIFLTLLLGALLLVGCGETTVDETDTTTSATGSMEYKQGIRNNYDFWDKDYDPNAEDSSSLSFLAHIAAKSDTLSSSSRSSSIMSANERDVHIDLRLSSQSSSTHGTPLSSPHILKPLTPSFA